MGMLTFAYKLGCIGFLLLPVYVAGLDAQVISPIVTGNERSCFDKLRQPCRVMNTILHIDDTNGRSLSERIEDYRNRLFIDTDIKNNIDEPDQLDVRYIKKLPRKLKGPKNITILRNRLQSGLTLHSAALCKALATVEKEVEHLFMVKEHQLLTDLYSVTNESVLFMCRLTEAGDNDTIQKLEVDTSPFRNVSALRPVLGRLDTFLNKAMKKVARLERKQNKSKKKRAITGKRRKGKKGKKGRKGRKRGKGKGRRTASRN